MTLIVQNAIDPQLINSLATLTGSQTLANKTIKTTKEKVTVTGVAPTSTTNFDVVTQAIVVYNTATNNFILNVRGDANTTLSSLLAVGESIGITLLVPNGSTAYYMNGLTIDGVAQTPKYQSGISFTAGNSNSTDMYNIFILRTGVGTYQVYASQTKFA
jgi:hypothetical protein